MNLTNLATKSIKITEEYLINNVSIILDNDDEVSLETYLKMKIIEVLEAALKEE
mgnify:CR=1 FL=1